ncbi:MAG TPA: hypothetical protein VHY79_12845 [Rhizomicrobium sp.]|nr:hypothetical protein [Rhizomicrobium sp.]
MPAAAARIVSFDPAGSIATYPYAINGSGAIAGYYMDSSRVSRGFLRDSSRKITSFSVSGSTSTIADCINDSGTVAGRYADGSGKYHGFLRTSAGQITTFSPGVAAEIDPADVNSAGAITGYYLDKGAAAHGFIRLSNGKFRYSTFREPQEPMLPPSMTAAWLPGAVRQTANPTDLSARRAARSRHSIRKDR